MALKQLILTVLAAAFLCSCNCTKNNNSDKENTMITVTVAGKVKPEYRTTFLKHMEELAPIVRAEKGCILYQQNISADDENLLFLYEKWESKEDLMIHLASKHMQEHLEEARPWFDWVDMKTFETQEFTLENN